MIVVVVIIMSETKHFLQLCLLMVVFWSIVAKTLMMTANLNTQSTACAFMAFVRPQDSAPCILVVIAVAIVGTSIRG